MLSEREEQILGELEQELGRTRWHRFRAPSLLIGVVLVFGGELVATPTGIVLALVGFLGMVFASAAYVAASRSRARRATSGSRIARLLRRW